MLSLEFLICKALILVLQEIISIKRALDIDVTTILEQTNRIAAEYNALLKDTY